ncbi:MAG: amino acid ABC transporter substrate-binding protein [Microcystaceae cyanobacterium]
MLKRFSSRLISFCLSLLALPFPVVAQEPSVLEQIKQTGLLKVALREDAVPFGYRDFNNNWTGVCLDLVALLKQRVIKELDQPVILVKLFKSTLFNRFDLVNDNVVYLECGPNTIRKDLSYDRVTFSEPFLFTGTQLLIRAADKQKINADGDLSGSNIGVLRYTSNAEFIRDRYPQATIQEFQGATGRLRGVQALRQEKIDAFASDGILLVGEALIQNLELGKDYVIVPKNPLNCESYGLILPQGDPVWLNLVNEMLKSEESRQLYRKWFGEILPQIEFTNNYCRQQNGVAP